jgi:hypothetical protein
VQKFAARMFFAFMKLEVLLNPFTICLLCAIGVMMISQYLANLIHKF